MKKHIFCLSIFLFIAFSFAGSVFATNISVPLQIPISGTGSIEVCAGEKCSGIAQYVSLIYRFLVGFAAVLAVLALVWGGVRWLTSGGESGKIQEAQKVIANAVIGLLIALLSYAGLYLINPALTQFNPLTVKPIKDIPLSILSVDGIKPDGKFAFQFTCTDDFFTLNPDIKCSALSQDVLSRIKNKCYATNDAITRTSYKESMQTLVHENMHGINNQGDGIYLGGGKLVQLLDPFSGATVEDVKKYIPPIFKTLDPPFFNLYILESDLPDHSKKLKTTISKNDPFSLFDELTSYIMDNKVGFELEKNCGSKYPKGSIDGVNHTVMMMMYTLSLMHMMEKEESGYLAGSHGLEVKNTTQYLIEEVMTLYGKQVDPKAQKFYSALKNHPEAEKVRETAKRLFNTSADPNWTNRILGF